MFLARSISRLQITFHFHVSLCVKCQRKSRSYTISVVVVGFCVVRNRTLLGVLSRFVYLLDFILQNEPVVFEICVARVLFFFLTSTVLSSRLMMHSSVDWSGTLEARSQTQHEMNWTAWSLCELRTLLLEYTCSDWNSVQFSPCAVNNL